MGYTAAEAHVHADELGDTFTDDMVERIRVRLGSPDRCPHGWPIDTEFEQEENHELEPLSNLEPGTRATIVRLAEHDGDLLHWFYDEGLVPGATLELESAPAGRRPAPRPPGGRRPRTIADKAAAGLFVRPPSLRSEAGAAASPAAARSASALSVRSHVKSWSSRPKWP